MCDQPTTVSLGRQPKRSANVCHKCNTAKPAVKIRHTFYCQPCFLIAFNNKFRSRIGKAFKLSTTKKPRVLLALSGGSASRALLDLVSNFSRLDYEKEDKQKFEKFVVCHVDESCLFSNSASNAAKIQEYVDAAGIEFSRVGLEEVFTSDDAGHVLEVSPQSSFISGDVRARVIASDASPLDKLLALFTATKKLSAQEDLLSHLRSTLLLREARRHNCTLVLLGDTCTRLAIRVITMTSRGRGAALPVELNDTSAWLGGIHIIRPLRECILKETGLYNYYKGLLVLPTPTLTTGLPVKASIDRLTEEFITGLDKDFPSTTSAVTRTAAKLTPQEGTLARRRCYLCQMPVEEDVAGFKTSHTVRTLPDHPLALPGGTDWAADTKVHDLSKHVCYACQTVLQELGPEARLPLPADAPELVNSTADSAPNMEPLGTLAGGEEWDGVIAATTTRKVTREEMRDSIGDFILE